MLAGAFYSGRIKALATGRTYGSIGDGGLAFPTLVQTVTGLGAGREPPRRGFEHPVGRSFFAVRNATNTQDQRRIAAHDLG